MRSAVCEAWSAEHVTDWEAHTMLHPPGRSVSGLFGFWFCIKVAALPLFLKYFFVGKVEQNIDSHAHWNFLAHLVMSILTAQTAQWLLHLWWEWNGISIWCISTIIIVLSSFLLNFVVQKRAKNYGESWNRRVFFNELDLNIFTN